MSEINEKDEHIYVIDDYDGTVFACVGKKRFLEYCKSGEYASILNNFGVTVWEGREEPLINRNADNYYKSLLNDET